MCHLIAKANVGSVIFGAGMGAGHVMIMMGTGSVPTAVRSALTAGAAMMFSGAINNKKCVVDSSIKISYYYSAFAMLWHVFLTFYLAKAFNVVDGGV